MLSHITLYVFENFPSIKYSYYFLHLYRVFSFSPLTSICFLSLKVIQIIDNRINLFTTSSHHAVTKLFNYKSYKYGKNDTQIYFPISIRADRELYSDISFLLYHKTLSSIYLHQFKQIAPISELEITIYNICDKINVVALSTTEFQLKFILQYYLFFGDSFHGILSWIESQISLYYFSSIFLSQFGIFFETSKINHITSEKILNILLYIYIPNNKVKTYKRRRALYFSSIYQETITVTDRPNYSFFPNQNNCDAYSVEDSPLKQKQKKLLKAYGISPLALITSNFLLCSQPSCLNALKSARSLKIL